MTDIDPDLEVTGGKTYTRPRSDLRKAETRHMLNGFVSGIMPLRGTPIDQVLASMIPVDLAERLIANRDALRMNYRIVKVGTRPMLLGRPVKEDA